MIHLITPTKNNFLKVLLGGLIFLLPSTLLAQNPVKKILESAKSKIASTQSKNDSNQSLLDINNTKLMKKINSMLDTNQKKINNLLLDKLEKAKTAITKKISDSALFEVERPLPYELLANKKYNLGRRAYQNTVSKYNYIFYAATELNEIIANARLNYKEDYTELLPFYDYDLANIAESSIDSIVYRCNANIVLHDLRSNWVDDAYLLMSKAYLFHKNFDTAGSLLQYINYEFDLKENGMDLPVGSNLRNTNGKFSIATKEDNRFWENRNIRNESMIWQARNYIEQKLLNEGISLLQLLKTDALFPKRLYPFLNEVISYGFYQSELYDSAANNLIKALPNAMDKSAKTRWYYLIGQLYEKVDNYKKAYQWFRKANTTAVNPIIAVYAKINMIKIDSKQSNTPWLTLAESIQKMSRREKYTMYSDIIFFEMAKLAIQNKAFDKATEWLITSIKKNANGLIQKQKAFELLGGISYDNDLYSIARLAYDSLSGVLKTNPMYETITLRKKWLPTIEKNDTLLQQIDTLELISSKPSQVQADLLKNWQSRLMVNRKILTNLFYQDSIALKSASLFDNPSNNFNQNVNPIAVNNNGDNDFYFENQKTITLGKQNFIQKFGQRPSVDNWRRKTSINLLSKETNSSMKSSESFKQDSTVSISILEPENSTDFLRKILLDTIDVNKANKIWNAAAMENAQVFLLKLNDFKKAFPLYKKIIDKEIDPIVTERALLDIASEYVHQGNYQSSDSIISIVQLKFPDGVYASKKSFVENKKKLTQSLEASYMEVYFASIIGDWDLITTKMPLLDKNLRQTKWYAPYQFIKVKMYAQQRLDPMAILLLDSIIFNYNNETIRDKAKNILTQLKNRKETEKYLSKMDIDSLKKSMASNIKKEMEQEDNSTKKVIKKDTTLSKIVLKADGSMLTFNKDEKEPHYIALLTNHIKEVLVKEVQNAFSYLNNDEFNQQKLNTTYIQFNDSSFVVWIGPFENLESSKVYIKKIKPRLNTEILSFIPSKQYELYLIGKSNITQIKNIDDLKQYKDFMIQNIYN